MKRLSRIFLVTVVIAATISACDIVDEPYLVPKGSNGTGPGENIRKVLLEEFTGQKCPNCPEGAELAHSLKIQYGEQLVLLSIHAGYYATPAATGDFTADYRTSAGDDLNLYFDIQGYPSGMINRTEYKGNQVLFKDDWEGAVAAQVDLPAQAGIDITNEYNASTRKLTCSLESTFFEDLAGTYNICVFLTESGIISPQQTEQGVDASYEHNHMLRAALNGTWGGLVGGDGTAVADVKLNDEFTITLDNAWAAENCGIVAFIYNTETLEIVQAEESAITE